MSDRFEELLYEHREDALTCYDHGGYCCVCGAHDVGGYRSHLASVIAASQPLPRGVEAVSMGARCACCGDERWSNPLPLAWIGRHMHGTGEAICYRLWCTGPA